MTSPANDAFTHAKEKYKERLTAKERARIETPISLDDLLSQAKAIGDALQQQNGFLHSLGGLSQASSNLKPFDQLLQGACKLSPSGGDLIWSSILFILEVRSLVSALKVACVERYGIYRWQGMTLRCSTKF